jgi:hypothetical protein
MLINVKDPHQWTFLKSLKKRREKTPCYLLLGLVHTNYNIFKNVEFFKIIFLGKKLIKNIIDKIFGNISFG